MVVVIRVQLVVAILEQSVVLCHSINTTGKIVVHDGDSLVSLKHPVVFVAFCKQLPA